jgi:hypothetical protein
VGKRAQALAAVYAGQLVEQPGHNRALGDCQQRVSRRWATRGEPSPQTHGVLVTVERVTGRIPNASGRTWRDLADGRGRAELGVLGAVVGLADQITRPPNRMITSPGPGVSVTAPSLRSWRLQLDRTSRHVATDDYSSQRGASAGQVDAHRCSLSLLTVPPCGPGRCSALAGSAASYPAWLIPRRCYPGPIPGPGADSTAIVDAVALPEASAAASES